MTYQMMSPTNKSSDWPYTFCVNKFPPMTVALSVYLWHNYSCKQIPTNDCSWKWAYLSQKCQSKILKIYGPHMSITMLNNNWYLWISTQYPLPRTGTNMQIAWRNDFISWLLMVETLIFIAKYIKYELSPSWWPSSLAE